MRRGGHHHTRGKFFPSQKSGSRPPKKKARVSAPIDLSEPSSEPPSEPQPSQPPATESQIPSSMTLEVIIRRPMVTQPPIEGPRSYCHHFTIDGRHGILGARHIAEALRIPYEPARPEDYRVWTHPSQSDIVHILLEGIHTPVSVEEGAPSQHVLYRCTPRHNIFPLQHWVQERSFARGIVQDI
ncbi:hypothetical protein CK203_064287 [Vitis vinifera]|uniref:Uncharacterized protein n=1 Tax=Vitis vinifera TaxID=29760 RepID=A0A438G9M6_VITVI|nr:hypothetical protein CK203_064287 [Vitis vinifera]